MPDVIFIFLVFEQFYLYFDFEFDSDFGAPFVRFCLASPHSVIKEVFDRLNTAFVDLE